MAHPRSQASGKHQKVKGCVELNRKNKTYKKIKNKKMVLSMKLEMKQDIHKDIQFNHSLSLSNSV